MTPILCRGLARSGRDPRPYLLGHAGAANVGSAATLVGNPQNILLGQHGGLAFWHYLAFSAPVSALALVFLFLVLSSLSRRSLCSTPTCNALLYCPPLHLPHIPPPSLFIFLVPPLLLLPLP